MFAPFAKEDISDVESYREELESQHFQKIRMADIIMVFNEDHYIGKSTQLELDYAISLKKTIRYLEW